MPRSGKVLIGPSAARHHAVDHARLVEALGLQIVHRGCRCSTAPGGSSRTAPCRRRAAWPRSSARVALRRIELAVDAELRRRREVEQLLELGHEVDLAAALEDVDALLGGDHRIAVEVGGALLELGEVLDASSARAASRTGAGCSRRAATACRCDGGTPAAGCRPTRWVGAVGVAVGVAVEAGHAAARPLASGDPRSG